MVKKPKAAYNTAQCQVQTSAARLDFAHTPCLLPPLTHTHTHRQRHLLMGKSNIVFAKQLAICFTVCYPFASLPQLLLLFVARSNSLLFATVSLCVRACVRVCGCVGVCAYLIRQNKNLICLCFLLLFFFLLCSSSFRR